MLAQMLISNWRKWLTLVLLGFIVLSLSISSIASGNSVMREPSAPQTLSDGLTAYWKLDETCGTRADVLGANEVMDVSSIQGVPGKVGDGAQFTDSREHYLNANDSPSLSTGDIDFTVAAWVNFNPVNGPQVSGDRTLISKYDNTVGNSEYLLRYSGADQMFRVVVDGGTTETGLNASSFGAATAGQWYFVVFWHDSVNNQLYIQVNNGAVDAVAHSAGLNDSTSPVQLGGNSTKTDFYLDGLLDEVGFWKRTLSDQERTALYNNVDTTDLFTSVLSLQNQLTAYWKLDEACGTRADVLGANEVMDVSSIQGVPGKVVDGAQFTDSRRHYLNADDSPSLSTGDIDFTIAAWVKLNSVSGQHPLISKYDNTIGNSEYLLRYDGSIGKFRAIVDGGTTETGLNASSFGTAGQWYFVVQWYDSVNNQLYIQVNNGAVDAVAHSAGLNDSTSPVQLGGNSATGDYLNGLLDEVGFWKRTLSDQERAALYNSGQGCPHPFNNCSASPTPTPKCPPSTPYYLNLTWTSGGMVGVQLPEISGVSRPSVASPNPRCYAPGTHLRLVATAHKNLGYVFSHWNNDIGDKIFVKDIVMTQDISVHANFIVRPPDKPIVVLVQGYGGAIGNDAVVDMCQSQPEHFPGGQSNREPLDYFFVYPQNLVEAGYDIYSAHITTGAEGLPWSMPGSHGYGQPGAGTPQLEYNAWCLSQQIDYIRVFNPNRKIILVAHSMGGLVSRAYLENRSLYPDTMNDITDLITLGSPHIGTPFGDFVCSLAGTRQIATCQFSYVGINFFNAVYKPNFSKITYNLIGGTALLGDEALGTLYGREFLFGDYNDAVVGALSQVGLAHPALQRLYPHTSINNISGRYFVHAVHVPSLSITGAPNYFTASTDSSDRTRTEAYVCVLYLLDQSTKMRVPPDGHCPTQTSDSLVKPAQVSATISHLPILSGVLRSTSVVSKAIPVDTNGLSRFSLSWLTGTVGFTLTNPMGVVIDPAYAVANPTQVAYSANLTNTNFLRFAMYAFTATTPGMYTVTITAGDVGISGTYFSAVTLVDSPRVLSHVMDAIPHAVGSTMVISANLQNAGVGLFGATVQAQVFKTGVFTNTIPLLDRGSGIYTNSYTIPNEPGYLGLSITAQGTDAGVPYARQVDGLFVVATTTLQLRGQYSDTAPDHDGNGKLDSLNVTVNLTATQPGQYLLSGDLMVSGTVVAHTVVSVSLTSGQVTSTLAFKGDDLHHSGRNGPYTLTNLSAIDQQNMSVPTIWQAQNVYSTAAYAYTDFASACFNLYLFTDPEEGGAVFPSAAPDCNTGTQFTSGSVVTLTATANDGYLFTGWDGDVEPGADRSVNVLPMRLDTEKVILAQFVSTRLFLPLIQR